MKHTFIIIFLMGTFAQGFSQTVDSQNQGVAVSPQNKIYENNLPVIFITKEVNILFRSPEKIQFVDLSSEKIVGDLPAANLARLKILKYKSPEVITDSLQIYNKEEIAYSEGENIGVITIVAQSFMAQ